MQGGADLQAVAPHHRGQRAAVEEAVSAGQSRLSEGGGRRQEGRPVLEGGSVPAGLASGSEQITFSCGCLDLTKSKQDSQFNT